jgi:hypothetical protein
VVPAHAQRTRQFVHAWALGRELGRASVFLVAYSIQLFAATDQRVVVLATFSLLSTFLQNDLRRPSVSRSTKKATNRDYRFGAAFQTHAVRGPVHRIMQPEYHFALRNTAPRKP